MASSGLTNDLSLASQETIIKSLRIAALASQVAKLELDLSATSAAIFSLYKSSIFQDQSINSVIYGHGTFGNALWLQD